MRRQLALLEPTRPDWRLDERTKDLGRKGVAAARAALAASAAPQPDDRDEHRPTAA